MPLVMCDYELENVTDFHADKWQDRHWNADRIKVLLYALSQQVEQLFLLPDKLADDGRRIKVGWRNMAFESFELTLAGFRIHHPGKISAHPGAGKLFLFSRRRYAKLLAHSG
ncbi:hypothetical protein D3C87_1665180 [compost metagenome]